jgi:hypothetical protein
MKIFTKAIPVLVLVLASICVLQVNAQSIINPTDTVYTYNATATKGTSTNPNQPATGTIGKWVKTTRMSWNTSEWKCYIYKGVAFRVHFPKTYVATATDGKKYPVLIFYHGAGEAGVITDNENSMAHGGSNVFQANINNGVWDGYVIFPQNTNGAWDPAAITYMKEVLDYMTTNNKVDPFHIVVNGLSAGGGGCWVNCFNYPQVISAAVIMSSNNQGNGSATNITKTKFTPLWDIQGGLDTGPSPFDANIVNANEQAAGAQYKYTIYADLGHGTWDRTWTEPDFWPFMNRSYSSNPWALSGKTAFCPGVTINSTLGVAPGFNAYEWRRNDTAISGSANSIVVTQLGKYTCRVQRNGIWSDWSHTPVVISIKPPTVTPAIKVSGLSSNVIPALDRSDVILTLPAGYASYVWQKVGSSSTVSSTNTLTVSTPGQYIAQVTETGGCSSSFGTPFTVVNAQGPNAPDAASGVSASPLTQTSLLLNWSQNPSPAHNETAFEVYQASKAGGPYTLVDILGADVSKDTISGLVAGTKYYYVVRAINATAASATSNEASTTTIVDAQAPTAPGALTVTASTINSVTLDWATSTDDVGVEAYDIYVNGVRTYTVPANQTDFTVYSLTNGQSYVFVVKAKDHAGNSSVASNQVSGEPLINGLSYAYFNNLATTLTALPNMTAMAPVKKGIVTTFSTTPKQDASYYSFLYEGFFVVPTTGNYIFQISSDDGSRMYIGSPGVKASPYNFAGTPAINNDGAHGSISKQSGTYSWTAGQVIPVAVAYMNLGGSGSLTVQWKVPGSSSYATMPASAFTQAAVNNGVIPADPANLVATAMSYKAIGLTWADSSNNESGFEILRTTNANYTGAVVIATTGANVTSFIDSTAAASTRYYYQVRAVNQYGSSNLTYNYKEAAWQFNNSLADSTGNNHGLTTVGVLTYDVTNKVEGPASIKFNGSNQSMTINNTGSFLQEKYSTRTVSLWVKANSATTTNRVLFDIGGSANGLALLMSANTTLTAAVASGSSRKNITATVAGLNWNHIVVVYNGDSLLLYVNDTLKASNLNLGFHSIATTTDGARIGQTNSSNAFNNNGSWFNGSIDNVEIFSTALSAATIADVTAFAFKASNATTQALPAIPAAPATLAATATSAAGIRLNWVDNANNETGYHVYRSNNDNQNYVLLATVPAGAVSYQDSGLFANARYYYKVNAVGIGGVSAFTNESNALTLSVAPVIVQIGNQQARYNATTIIAVKATLPGGSITLTASNLPSFAQLTDNGDGTGKITLTPSTSDAGNYTGLKVTASNSVGSSNETIFNLAVNNNFAPTLDSIANYSLKEGDSLTVQLNGANVNPADVLTLAISNLPNFYTLNQGTTGAGTLVLKPGFAAAGTYAVSVALNDDNGLSVNRVFNLTVVDKDPTTKIFTRVKYQATAPAPWNNISGTVTNNLKDQYGNTTPVGLTFNPTSWWAPYNAGATTGNNSGVYPDVVLSEFFYFGFFDGPATSQIVVSGLDISKKYDLTFLGSSTLAGIPDNGITRYSVGSRYVDLAVQNNTKNTVLLDTIAPAPDGTITVNLSKVTSYPPGYLNALVIANHFDDGTAPAAPNTLKAQIAAKGVGLTWNDPAYNETGYQVYRSVGDSLSYTLLSTLAAGASSFNDSTTNGSTQYYYKVNALNAVGTSAYSNQAGIIAPGRVPVIAAVADVTVNNNATAQVTVTATDDPSDHLTLTASGLPSFASFTDNGDGTGTVSIVPTAGLQGYFPNVTITATDMSDSTGTTRFNINVVDPALDYVYVNITTPTYQAPAPWNNLTAGYIPYAGTAFTNLKSQTGASTGINVTLTDAWSFVAESGMKRRNGSDVYPESVLAGSFYASDNNVHRITISGLNPAKAYNFQFFASHFTSESTLSNFTANGQTISLNGSQNSNTTAQLNGIIPDAGGNVVINGQKDAAAKFLLLSALVIQSYTPGSTTPIAPADLRVLDFRKTNTVPLQWQDRASNETAYEVWRAPHGGTYSLLVTLPANATSYLDSNLTANTAYDYTVRAVNGTLSSAYSNPVKGYTYAGAVYVFFNRTWAPPYNFPTAPAPFNNLNWTYQAINTEWDNFKDENGLPTNIGLLQPTQFDEVDPFGATTGNNSGVYPDLAMSQGFLNFPGTVSYVTVTGLDVSKKYDFTMFASVTDDPTGNASSLYTINGQSGVLNAHQNTTGTLTFFGITPDANGNVNVGLKTYDSSNTSFAALGNIAIKGYTPTAGDVSVVPTSTQVFSRVASATAGSLALASTNINDTAADIKPLQAYPNPFDQSFNLTVPATAHDNVLVMVLDVSGKVIYGQRYEDLFEGNNTIQIAPTGVLTRGMYFVKVIYLNKNEQKLIKLIKR